MSKEEFRDTLQRLEQESQRSYDKTLITLSSGGLILSVTYLSQLSDLSHQCLLVWAWVAWCFTLAAMLLSFLLSVRSMRRGQEQCDDDDNTTPTGGPWSKIIGPLNWMAGISFIIGVVLILFFAGFNQRGNHDGEEKGPTTRAATWNGVP